MSAISDGVRNLFIISVRLLNQPIVKEGVKNIAGAATFVFGLMEIYDVYQILRGREIVCESCPGHHKWVEVANKVIIVCAKISLILSAGVSRPGIFIISALVGRIFSTTQLNRVFGPNAIFAVNAWHPRHVVSLVAVVLALASIAQSTYTRIHWTFKKVQQYQVVRIGLTDTKIRLTTIFNTMTSRPVLHLGNQWGRFIFASNINHPTKRNLQTADEIGRN
jgi:hypothetical protein